MHAGELEVERVGGRSVTRTENSNGRHGAVSRIDGEYFTSSITCDRVPGTTQDVRAHYPPRVSDPTYPPDTLQPPTFPPPDPPSTLTTRSRVGFLVQAVGRPAGDAKYQGVASRDSRRFLRRDRCVYRETTADSRIRV